MTPQEIEALIFNLDENYSDIIQAFESFSDGNRRAVSNTIQILHRQVHKNKPSKSASEFVTSSLTDRHGEDWKFWHHIYNRKSALCMYAAAPFSVIKSSFLPYRNGPYHAAFKTIIETRKPDWLPEWVKWQCELEEPRIDFPFVWGWYKAGVIPEPNYEAYYRLFANSLMATDFYTKSVGKPITQALKDEPHWLTYIPTLFSVESNAFNTNPWLHKGANDDHEMWPQALIKLVDEGVIEKGDLLSHTLFGLTQDLKQNQLSGIHKLHSALSPSSKQRAEFAEKYLDLIDHRVGHVAKFALTQLRVLSKLDDFDEVAFLTRSEDAFIHARKGNAKLIISIIQTVIKRQNAINEGVTIALISALKNEHADIQSAALNLLGSADLSASQKLEISKQRDFLPPSLQANLDKLIGAVQKVSPERPSDQSKNIRLNKLPKHILKASGLDQFEADHTVIYAPVSSDWRDHAILENFDKLEPIEDVNTLIDRLAQAVEVTDKPATVYDIVDGISRLCGQTPPEFEEKTSALVKRLGDLSTDWDEAAAHQGFAHMRGAVRRCLLSLSMAWLRPNETIALPNGIGASPPHRQPYLKMLKALTENVRNKRARPLLSTPSHVNGWLDPRIWVERLNLYHQHGWDIEKNDLLVSLPRLSPQHKEEAYSILDETPLREFIAFALGISNTIDPKGDPALWITAARASNPDIDWRDMFRNMNVDMSILGSLSPIQYDWRAYVEERTYEYYEGVHKVNLFKLTQKFTTDTHASSFSNSRKRGLKKIFSLKSKSFDPTDLPYASFHVLRENETWYGIGESVAWRNSWDFTLCPSHRIGANLRAIQCLANTIDEDATRTTHKYSFFQHLFVGDQPWDEATHLMICLGLARKEADGRGMAVDAMIYGIEKGAIDPDILAVQLIGLSQEPWLKLNRLSQSILTVSDSSLLHAYVISLTIQNWLPQTDLNARGMYGILEVLLNTQATIQQPLIVNCQKALRSLKGSSKAAKTAKALLALDNDDSDIRKHIRNLAISRRL